MNFESVSILSDAFRESLEEELGDPCDKDIDYYRKRVVFLEKLNRWYMLALELLSSLNKFNVDPKDLSATTDIFVSCRNLLNQLIQFRFQAFYFKDPNHGGFTLIDYGPGSFGSVIKGELDYHIENGNFAFALKSREPALFKNKNSSGYLIFHSLATRSKILGVYVGEIDNGTKTINFNDRQTKVISLVLQYLAYSIENSIFRKFILDLKMKKAQLTDREKEIAWLVYSGEGPNDQMVADQLNISPHTAKDHMKSIFQKCKVHSREGLINFLKV